MATHSSILAWKIPWQEGLTGYSPWGPRVGHDGARMHQGLRWSSLLILMNLSGALILSQVVSLLFLLWLVTVLLLGTEKRSWRLKESEVAQSCPRLFATPWSVDHQVPLSMGFSRQEYWRGLPFPSAGDLPNPGIESRSPALQADALTTEPPGKSYGGWSLAYEKRGTEKPPCPGVPQALLGIVLVLWSSGLAAWWHAESEFPCQGLGLLLWLSW